MKVIKNVYIRTSFVISLIFILIGLALALNAFLTTKHLLIIHFDSYRGIDFLGDKLDVFSILGVGFFINLINFFISNFLYDREKFLSLLISFSSAFFSLLILIVVAVIISIN